MIQDAIKLAIEKGGYAPPVLNWYSPHVVQHYVAHITLAPAFWQALGKAKGWKPRLGVSKPYVSARSHPDGAVTLNPVEVEDIDEWKYHALRYLETLLTEGQKKADEYLSTLLK